MVLHNIETIIPRTDAAIWTIHPFEGDKLLIANDCIQGQKPVSAKKKKRTVGCGLIIYKTASYDKQLQ